MMHEQKYNFIKGAWRLQTQGRQLYTNMMKIKNLKKKKKKPIQKFFSKSIYLSQSLSFLPRRIKVCEKSKHFALNI